MFNSSWLVLLVGVSMCACGTRDDSPSATEKPGGTSQTTEEAGKGGTKNILAADSGMAADGDKGVFVSQDASFVNDDGHDASSDVAAALDPIDELKSAFATKDSARGDLHLQLSSVVETCTNKYAFPKDCTPAWRLRIDVPFGSAIPGSYPLDAHSEVSAYLDAQGPTGGTQCENLGTDFTGTLVITSVGLENIKGSITGNAQVHGTFVADMCAVCKSVGETCAANSECCNDDCSGTCKP